MKYRWEGTTLIIEDKDILRRAREIREIYSKPNPPREHKPGASSRLNLDVNDFDYSLVEDQMHVHYLRMQGAEMPVSEIVGSEPGVVAKAVYDDHHDVLTRSMERW
jgi:hypothetical protein